MRSVNLSTVNQQEFKLRNIRCQKPLENYMGVFSDDIFSSIFGISLMQVNTKSPNFKSSFCQ